MAKLLWQPARRTAVADQRPVPAPWRQLIAPCLVTLIGGIVVYALIVQLWFVLDGLDVTSTATIGAISAAMSLATAARLDVVRPAVAAHILKPFCRWRSACPPPDSRSSAAVLAVVTLLAVPRTASSLDGTMDRNMSRLT